MEVCNKYIYNCITGRAIQGNIPVEIDYIGPIEVRDDTEVENGIFSRINCTNRFIII